MFQKIGTKSFKNVRIAKLMLKIIFCISLDVLNYIRPSFFYFLIYEKIFKMLESGGRNKNKNSKIEESKKKKKKELNNIFFFKPLIKIKSNTKYLVFQLVQIHKFQVGS